MPAQPALPGAADVVGRACIVRRVCVPALVALAALVLAAPSVAALTPHLVVSSTVSGPSQLLTIDAAKTTGDDPVARVQLVVPSGYQLDSPVPGTTVGTAGARVIMRDLDPSAEQVLKGTVTAISPSDPTIAYEGATCDNGQHLAAWSVQLRGKKGSFSFPVYVDATSGSTAPYGPYVLVACFRSADLAPTDPNRSVNGSLIQSFHLELTPFTRPTESGGFRWRSLWTPYTVGTAILNTPATVEVQSVVVIPTGQIVIFGNKSTVTAHGKSHPRVQISGQVLVQDELVSPVTVTIRHGSTKTKLVSLGGIKVATDGSYSKYVLLLAPTQYYQAVADLPAKDLGADGCQASFPGTPCLDATSGAGRVESGVMLVKR